MIFFYKCIRIKVTEQRIVNPIIVFMVFAADFKGLKNESKYG